MLGGGLSYQQKSNLKKRDQQGVEEDDELTVDFNLFSTKHGSKTRILVELMKNMNDRNEKCKSCGGWRFTLSTERISGNWVTRTVCVNCGEELK